MSDSHSHLPQVMSSSRLETDHWMIDSHPHNSNYLSDDMELIRVDGGFQLVDKDYDEYYDQADDDAPSEIDVDDDYYYCFGSAAGN